MIELKGVSKSFGNKKILEDVNIKIELGTFFLIKGESGKGKTTILNIIGMLEKADEGMLIINNFKNPKIEKKSGRDLLKKEISYLFQNYGLVDNENIKENLNIALKFRKKNKKEKKSLMEDNLSRLNLDVDLNRKIYELSGGEQQRVALAKIMLKESNIILCDEPTGSLDEKNRDEIIEMLLKYKEEGKTIVMVSHDPIMEKFADDIYIL